MSRSEVKKPRFVIGSSQQHCVLCVQGYAPYAALTMNAQYRLCTCLPNIPNVRIFIAGACCKRGIGARSDLIDSLGMRLKLCISIRGGY